MSICDISEKTIGTLTLETRAYEDGYIQTTLMDEFGAEIASLDGHSRGGSEFDTKGLIEDYLLSQYL